MGTDALGMVIDDFNGDNFDHKDLGFVGGGYVTLNTLGGRPISFRPVPAGTPTWGREWKAATAKWYRHAAAISVQGSNYASRGNHLDLDPTYRDPLGRPLLRMTYNFTDNDRKMSAYVTGKAAEIAKAMGAQHITARPRTGVVNRYLQSWDAHNLFVLGSSVFPQNPGYNPTGAAGALAYWAADAIVGKYLKNPSALIPA